MIGSSPLYLTGFFLDPEMVQSSILRLSTANQLAETVTTTSTADDPSDTRTDKDLRVNMSAYSECGQFMANLLYEEINSGRDHPAFDRYADSDAIIDAFKDQCERFVRQRAPFSNRNGAWVRLYDYYLALLNDPDAAIFAFVAIKVLSILPTSMPEERTMSFFTKINAKDRSNQDSQTTIAMAQVHQDLRRHPEYTLASKKKAAPRKVAPLINWRSVGGLFSSATLPATAPAPAARTAQPVEIDSDSDADVDANTSSGATSAPGATATPSADVIDADNVAVGLAALQESLEADDPVPAKQTSVFFNTEISGIDSSSPFFRDLLSDTPIDGAEKFKGFAGQKETSDTSRRGAGKRNLASGLKKFTF
ncbi:hypothetical protein C8F01DRAFT_1268957 [Mycena amicta]|nr:hypothetical protein C8F01DRAFT_1268957 [Mycena amicta]